MTNPKDVVRDAFRITSVLNRHMAEFDCAHSIKDITEEIFEIEKTSGLARPEQAQPITPRPTRNDSHEYSR